jgi:N-acylneuraminate cytidylyltransferase
MLEKKLKTIAIIPARGGSKGIPRKNVRNLGGKPLIAHAVLAAKRAQTVDRVVVSTDDAEIAAIAEAFGAETVRRPADISGDRSRSEEALLHALRALAENDGYRPDIVVFIQCTSPLTAAEDIDGTVRAMLEQSADTALAVAPFHYFLWKTDGEGGLVGVNHDKSERLLRQEQEPQYLEAGAVYAMMAGEFQRVGHRFFGKTAMYVMPGERHWEIDEPADMDVAEVLMRRRGESEKTDRLPDPIAGVAFDFDGVFTDNRVMVSENGLEAVVCSRSDGWAVAELRTLGIPMVVISTEKNRVVEARCRKLGLACIQGVDDKRARLSGWARELGASLDNLIFVGNDVNDLDCLRAVGCPVVVGDAHPAVKPHARIVLAARGGAGAIRELAEMIKGKTAG